MLSTEKVLTFILEAQDQPDEELREALPIAGASPTLVRGALAMIAQQLPQDPGELDTFLERASDFCLALRSDDEPATTPA